MSTKHKLKIHRWKNGRLETTEHFFDTLEDAQLLARSTDGHSYKIYNDLDELVESGGAGGSGDSYAG
jgi:hypothetical protein